MRFLDTRLDPTLRTDADLANLAWFGAVGAVVGPPVLERVETAAELIAAFRHAVESEVPRVRAAGLDAALILGVDAASRPRRSHPEVFHHLEVLAASGTLAGIGPIDIDDSVALLGQVEIAARHRLPGVVRIPPLGGAAAVEHAFDAANRLGDARPVLVLDGCDYTSLRAALDADAWVTVDVSPGGQGCDAVDMLVRFGDAALRRAMLASGASPAFDVLAIPRAAARLLDGGVPRAAVERVVHGNTAALFGLPPSR